LRETPFGYISGRRLEVAAKLLIDSRLWLWEVADTVGYASLTSFSRAFFRHFGQRPRQYRLEHRPASQAGTEQSEIVGGKREKEASTRLLHRALAGTLGPNEARGLTELLEKSYEIDPESIAAKGVESFERTMALRLWKDCESLPAAERIGSLRNSGLNFRSAALFVLLKEKSRTEGRKDRTWGARLAGLAVDSLEASAPFLGPQVQDLRTQAWACAGNAHRLNSNFDAAERAFLRAEAAWSIPRPTRSRVTEAELLAYKAALRQDQSRLEEAIELSDQAIPILQGLQRVRVLAQTLILRAGLSWQIGKVENAFRDLFEAQDLLDGEDPPMLTLMTFAGLILLLTQRQRLQEAAEALQKAKMLCSRLKSPLARHRLTWVEGLLMQESKNLNEAERLIRQARNGFLRRSESAYVMLTSLDLAHLCLQQKRGQEAQCLVTEVLPLLEAMKVKPQTLAALHVLQNAIGQGQVDHSHEQTLRRLIAELSAIPALLFWPKI
jgi:tetratricopeptide (TPR) repeat protein